MPCQYAARRLELVRNLLSVYHRSSLADRDAGLAWYPRACYGVEQWAKTLGLPRATVACVIATLSPQCRWEANLRIALEMLSGRMVSPGEGALNANIRKAYRVLADRADSVAPYFVSAPKVTAFSLNLQGYANAITVDTHAAQAALEDSTVKLRLPAARYSVFEASYRDAATLLGIRPCDFQAIIWCRWKREFSPEAKRFHIASGTQFLKFDAR